MFIEAGLNRQRGITLVEQIVFIVVVSVGVLGVLSTMGPSLRFSADPQLRKQQLAIAESLLSEILHQPFTYCDPDDGNASTAALSGTTPNCDAVTNIQDGDGVTDLIAAPAGETRFGGAPGSQYDNVSDYAGYSQTGVTGLSGAAVSGYTAQVAIARDGTAFSLPHSAVLRIDVTVAGNGAEPFTLTGYRFRYAPRY